MHPRRRAAVVVAAAALAPTLLAVPASSYADTVGLGDASDASPTTVVVQLAAPDPDRLARLAGRPIVNREARLERIADLVPDPAQQDAVATDLRDRGFTVDDESTWSVTATAPAAVVAATFGSASATTGTGTTLPLVPASLVDAVTAAVPADGPALLHPAASGALTGADVRNADAPAGIAASTGGNDASLTVATIQFATWDPADLTTFARSTAVADPVASGQYRRIDVAGGTTSVSGTEEVAIDQESLLAVAPTARQAAYFAPNSAYGFLHAVAQVYADATGGAGATSPDPHIAALSISWGACESKWGDGFLTAMNNELTALTGAGVTVFAASGDSGIYDCHTADAPDYRADVDFPASSPAVVAVGGTTLRPVAVSAPNTGTNWTETAWSCTSQSTCPRNATGGGASGSGGVVTGFAEPSWQQAALTDAPFAATTTRLVPDIAAAGDPRTGMRLYSAGTWRQYGGTSLAAPLSAGQLIDTLGDAGRDVGVGDIHVALYQAYTATRGLAVTDPARVFRDVTVGTNGASPDRGLDPSVRAGAGYDTVSGLGGVLWAALGPYLRVAVPTPSAPSPATPTTTPTVPTVPIATGPPPAAGKITISTHLRLQRRARSHRAVARWSTSATEGTVAATSVRITDGTRVVYAGTIASGRTAVRVRPGRTYVLIVAGRDSDGDVTRRTARLRVPGSRRGG